MAWEEKCIGCLCNNCFMKNLCCGVDGCRRRKKCIEYHPVEAVQASEDLEEDENGKENS